MNTKLILLIVVTFMGGLLQAQPDAESLKESLDSRVYKAPKVYWEPSKDQGNVKAFFYETLPNKGKETRAFAYIGIPESDHPVPAVVLVHGGGGTAFYKWVQIWNDRGYAAIAMSLEGHMPDSVGQGKFAHEYSGPTRVGTFQDADLPLNEQWMYHAISDVMIGHSLLASLSEVDAHRVGITGISWGGVLSSLISGVDTRLKCAMPVYGAGYLYESKGHFGEVATGSTEFQEKKKFWDPSNQFSAASVPTLWVNGDSDAHFSVNITSHSYQTTSDRAFISIHHGMKHGHPQGWNPNEVPEIYAFADKMLKGAPIGLGSITQQPSGRNVNMTYVSQLPIVEATVYYLDEELTYRKPKPKAKHAGTKTWETIQADVNTTTKEVKVQLPETAITYYVNLKDSRGCIISSILVELARD